MFAEHNTYIPTPNTYEVILNLDKSENISMKHLDTTLRFKPNSLNEHAYKPLHSYM